MMRFICFTSDKRAAQRRSHDSRTQVSIISRHSCGHHSRTSEYIYTLILLVYVRKEIFHISLTTVATGKTYLIKKVILQFTPLIVP